MGLSKSPSPAVDQTNPLSDASLPQSQDRLSDRLAQWIDQKPEDIALDIASLTPSDLEQIAAFLHQSAQAFSIAAADFRRTKPDLKADLSRAPNQRELAVVRSGKILVLAKESKLAYDSMKRNQSEQATLDQYRSEGVDAEVVLAAHRAHQQTLEDVCKLAEVSTSLSLEREDSETIMAAIAEADLVIAVGGDDHLKAVAHRISNTPLLAVNSDPQRSMGALCSITAPDLPKAIQAISSGNFLIQEWVRLEAVLERPGHPSLLLPPALSEIGIADLQSDYTMRGTCILGEQRFGLKASGLLVATGAGSTGWFDAAVRAVYPAGKIWPRTEEKARFVIREPYQFSGGPQIDHGEILPGQELIIISSSNHSAQVSIDGAVRFPFPRGSTVRIHLSPSKISMVKIPINETQVPN